MKKRKPLTDNDGEVRELLAEGLGRLGRDRGVDSLQDGLGAGRRFGVLAIGGIEEHPLCRDLPRVLPRLDVAPAATGAGLLPVRGCRAIPSASPGP